MHNYAYYVKISNKTRKTPWLLSAVSLNLKTKVSAGSYRFRFKVRKNVFVAFYEFNKTNFTDAATATFDFNNNLRPKKGLTRSFVIMSLCYNQLM